MPNWTYNEVIIKGEKETLREIIAKVSGDDKKIDFNLIVPMPETMNVSVNNYEDDNLRYYCLSSGKEIPEAKGGFVFCLQVSGEPYTLAEYQAFAKEHPDLLSLKEGKKIYTNLTQYGYKDWYEWRNKHWGTKWNACEPAPFTVRSDKEIFSAFDTAWNAPYPVIEALSKMFPSVTISMSSTYEEGFEERTVYQDGKEIMFEKIEHDEEFDYNEDEDAFFGIE